MKDSRTNLIQENLHKYIHTYKNILTTGINVYTISNIASESI